MVKRLVHVPREGPRAEAGQTVAPVHDVPAAALAAFGETREKVLRTSCPVELFRISLRRDTAHYRLSGLHLVPQFVLHDAQMRNVGRHPLRGQVGPRNASPRVRILHLAQAVPHEPPEVQLVVQDSRAARWITVNRARIPQLAFGPEQRSLLAASPLPWETHPRRSRGRSDESLRLPATRSRAHLSLSRPPASDFVAVAEAASRLPDLHASTKASACLICEVLQEQGVHCALETDVEVCDVALGERDDIHAGEGKALKETRGVFLVPTETVPRAARSNTWRFAFDVPTRRIADRGAGIEGEVFANTVPLMTASIAPTAPIRSVPTSSRDGFHAARTNSSEDEMTSGAKKSSSLAMSPS